MEMWRDIAGYEGHYQISNYGNVRNIKNVPTVLKKEYGQWLRRKVRVVILKQWKKPMRIYLNLQK